MKNINARSNFHFFELRYYIIKLEDREIWTIVQFYCYCIEKYFSILSIDMKFIYNVILLEYSIKGWKWVVVFHRLWEAFKYLNWHRKNSLRFKNNCSDHREDINIIHYVVLVIIVSSWSQIIFGKTVSVSANAQKIWKNEVDFFKSRLHATLSQFSNNKNLFI